MTPLACIACGADDWSPLHRVLVRCNACGFVRASDIPSDAELARIYQSDYFNGEEYADYLGDAVVHRENFERRFARIKAVAGPLESLYEVGCAYGLWLQVASAHGVRAAGSDLSADAVQHAAGTLGLDAKAGAFADLPIAPGAFRAFCLWDTIEHLAHPESHVARIAGLLPSGGWLFATTGDLGSATAQREGAAWRMIHPPTHLQYFSRDSITRLFARHGLTVTHIETVPMCRSVYATLEGLRRFGRGPLRALAGVAAAVLPATLTRRLRYTLDLGDIMLVCARKP